MDIQKTIEKAKTKHMVSLEPSDAFSYFFHGWMFVVIAFFFLWDYILDFIMTGGFYNPELKEVMGFICIAISLGCFLTKRQLLRFDEISTNLPKEELQKLFREVAEAYGLKPLVVHPDLFVFEYLPESMDKGQRITIVLDSDKVLFNSITRPQDVGGRRAVSIGENTTNLEIFREEITNRERKYGQRPGL